MQRLCQICRWSKAEEEDKGTTRRSIGSRSKEDVRRVRRKKRRKKRRIDEERKIQK